MKSNKKFHILVFLVFIAVLSLICVACNTPNEGDEKEQVRVEYDESGNEYVLSDDCSGYDLKYVNAGEIENIIVLELFNELPIKNILANSFRDCSKVKSITIPNGINVKDDAFFGCSCLEILTIPEIDYGVLGQYFGTRFFEGAEIIDHDLYGSTSKKYYIPSSLTSVTLTNASVIWSRAFSNCSNLISIQIFGSVDTVGTCAFGNCISLRNLSLPATIKKISPSGLAGCTSLKHIDLPQNLTIIDEFAFMNDTALEDIAIPDNVSSIGRSAFYGCTGLKSITVGLGVKYISEYAFANCHNVENLYFNAIDAHLFGGNENMIFANLGKDTLGTIVCIGSSVEKVPAYMLYAHYDEQYCPNVTDIVFSENSNCTIINGYAFTHLHNLKNITLVDGLETIGSYAFWYCSSLEKITIPRTVTKILAGAFSCNATLREIEFKEVGMWNVYITTNHHVSVSVENSELNAKYFTDEYRGDNWEKV